MRCTTGGRCAHCEPVDLKCLLRNNHKLAMFMTVRKFDLPPSQRTRQVKTYFLRILAICAAALFAAAASAQQDFSKVEIQTEKLADTVYMMTGAGGNLGVSVGEDAVFVIDDQFAPLTPKIQAEIAKLTDKPVKFLLNTHWHFDHTGGNENMGKAGVLIFAHENVRKRLSAEGFIEFLGMKTKPEPRVALPVVTFTRDLTFDLNGDELVVTHVPRAHTDSEPGAAEISTLREGALASASLLVGIVPWGIVTGVAMVSAGLTQSQAVAMSVLVFAGTAQLAVLPLLIAKAPLWVMCATALVVNLRYVIYSAVLAPHFEHLPRPWRVLLSYITVDGVFALFAGRYRPEDGDRNKHWFFHGGSLVMWCAWQVSSGIGIFAGAMIPAEWS